MSMQKSYEKNGVSIIIVSFNTIKLLKNCINSLVKNTKGLDYEIIVIDNNSTDGTKKFLNTISSNNYIKAVFNKENIGFGKANNVAIDVAKYDYLLFL